MARVTGRWRSCPEQRRPAASTAHRFAVRLARIGHARLEAHRVHITLIGGGWDEAFQRAVYGPFVRAASAVAARRSRVPRVAVVLLDEGEGVDAYGGRFVNALHLAGEVEPFIVPIPVGGRAQRRRPRRGGWAACRRWPHAGVRQVPGARPGRPGSVASRARRALCRVLGRRRNCGSGRRRRRVAPRRRADLSRGCGEDLEEVTVVAGLGLVPFTVEVHADAWETTPRLRAAIAELGEGHVGYALDEDTALVVHANELTTVGRGAATRIA